MDDVLLAITLGVTMSFSSIARLCFPLTAALAFASCVGPEGPPGADGADGTERTVHRESFESYQPGESGLVPDRELVFDKQDDDSELRISYTDLFGVLHQAGNTEARVCFWEVLVNGDSCSDPIIVATEGNSPGEFVVSSTVFGWCSDVPAGEVVLEVEVEEWGANGECFTGLNGLTGWLEAEELAE